MKKITSLFTSICFFMCLIISGDVYASPYTVSLAFAQQPVQDDKPKISPLEKGDKAPFSGTLFNAAAASQVMVDLDTAKEKCEIEIKREVGSIYCKAFFGYGEFTCIKDCSRT